MVSPRFFESIHWRSVAGLLVAGVLGWLLAWLVIPHPVVEPRGADSQASNGSPRPPAPAAPQPSGALPSRSAESLPPPVGIERLWRQQAKISESAAGTVAAIPAPSASLFSAKPSASASRPNSKNPEDAARAAKLKSLIDMRASALLELQSVPPNDTRRMMAIVEKFDTQMRAAGAPAILDLDNLRKTLESANRLSDLSQQMQVEADKGKAADIGRLQAMSQEMQALQKAMPKQVYRPDVLRQVLSQ